MKKNTMLILIFVYASLTTIAQEKYAVLICGAPVTVSTVPDSEILYNTNSTGNYRWDEFWNDTYLMWEMLVKPVEDGGKGYDHNNVFVLFADGDDYYFDEMWNRYNAEFNYPLMAPVTDDEATVENVEDVFSQLATVMTPDDFLFVWTFGHGGFEEPLLPVFIQLYSGGVYCADDFAVLVNQINCYKKVFWMQQCVSGGFVEYLEGQNSIINTSVDNLGIASVADDLPDIENEAYQDSTYKHAEFDFHIYSSTNGETPDYRTVYYNENLSNADVNNDNYISIQESADWESDHESQDENPQYSDVGSIGAYTSLKYPTLLHTNITSNETHRGLIGVSKDIHVTAGNQLTFYENAVVDIVNNSDIIVDAGATLIIEDNVTISGNSTNKIIVNGNIQIGQNVTFKNLDETEYFYGLVLNNTAAQHNFSQLTFTEARLYNYSIGLTVSNSAFNDCYRIFSNLGDVTFNNCTLNDTELYLENQWETHDFTASVSRVC